MTFIERYSQEITWHGKVTVMSLYHSIMSVREQGWTISKTARDFGVSMGLVSENLKLADLFYSHPTILKCKSRQEALERRRKDGL